MKVRQGDRKCVVKNPGGEELPLFEKPHLDHAKHLCMKVETGMTLDEYKKLVRDAKWICRQCGRVAASSTNLCDPDLL